MSLYLCRRWYIWRVTTLNVYMNGVVRKVLGKGLELLTVNGGRFELNRLLFADNTALEADSEEKLLMRW